MSFSPSGKWLASSGDQTVRIWEVATGKELLCLKGHEGRAYHGERDESAFAALVKRHGAMVLHVGQRVLHNGHDAEDVFQAAFLVLTRKAGSLRWHESVGNWLYQTAYRIVLKARTSAARRGAKGSPRGSFD